MNRSQRAARTSAARRRGGVVAAAALAISTVALATTAAPASAASGIPTTSAPDLVSATLVSGNSYGVQEQVQYCFDYPIDTLNSNLFYVRTYDASRYLHASVADKAQNPDCIIASFDENAIDLLSQGSVAEVDQSAVTGNNKVDNYYASVPLNSNLAPKAGATTAPDLTSANINSTTPSTVDFFFDDPIDPASADATKFHAVGTDGTDIGTATLEGTPTGFPARVRMDFGTDVRNAVAFTTDSGAVSSPNSAQLVGGVTPSAPSVYSRSTPSTPVLKAAAPATGDQFRLTFSAKLDPTFDTSKIIAVFDNGATQQATAGSAHFNDSPNQVLVSFPAGSGVVEEPSSVVRIIAQSGAANVFGSSPLKPSPVSAVNVSTAPMSPGHTTAPDLVNVQLLTGDNQAVFQYDEKVYSANTADLDLLTSAGEILPNQGLASPIPASGTTDVVVNFDDSFSSGIGVTEATGAVSDIRAQSSPNAAVVPHTTTTGCTSNCTTGGGGGGGHTVTPPQTTGPSAACVSATHKVKTLKAKIKKAKKKHQAAKVKKDKKKLKKAKRAKKSAC